jgi:hypothetical protein
MTLIAVQDEFVAAFTSAKRRWGHRKNGGHSARIIRGARKAARTRLVKLGFPESQIPTLIKDAQDMAELELSCD